MVSNPLSGITSKIDKNAIIGVVVGAAIGYVLRTTAKDALTVLPMHDAILFTSGSYQLTGADIWVMGIGLLLALFGNKIHSMLKWVGVGLFGIWVASEIMEVNPLGAA